MRFTDRGYVVIATTIGLGLSIIIFRDTLVSIIFLGVFFLLDAEVIWAVTISSYSSRFFKLGTSESKSELLVLGESIANRLDFLRNAKGRVNVYSPNQYLKIDQVGSNVIRTKFSTPYSGSYKIDRFMLEVTDPLGIIIATCKIPVSLKFEVRPRIYDIAVIASRILGKAGVGETPIATPGIGTEFYEIRGYQVGDDIRKINWKSTARHGELIVNDYSKETGASYYLVLEAVAVSDFDRDRLASTFLQIANYLTLSQTPFGVIVHDGKNIIALKKIDASRSSLQFALEKALEFHDLNRYKAINELAPVPSFAIKSTRDLMVRSGLGLLSEMEDIAYHEAKDEIRQDVFATMVDLVKESQTEPPGIVYVSGLFGEIPPIIEVAGYVKRTYNSEFVVLDPAAPWVISDDIQKGVELYENHVKTLKALGKSSIEYYSGEPLKITEQFFSGI